MSNRPDVDKALFLILDYGQVDGAHHKAWVIDQVLRALVGSETAYSETIERYQYPEGRTDDDDKIFDWDAGIAP